MADIEIKRGYEVLSDNNVRFGIRVINTSDSAILDVEAVPMDEWRWAGPSRLYLALPL